jgi:hypothetical protein
VTRPRIEDCDVIDAARLRRVVAPDAETHRIAGVDLVLLWRRRDGCWGGRPGRELLVRCPRCDAPRRRLHRPPGGPWCCWRCTPLSTPSHRRNGGRRGRGKPAQWTLQQIEAETQRCVELLQLQEWPPRLVLWTIDDLRKAPRRPGARLSRKRKEALVQRLDDLHTLQLGYLVPLLNDDLAAMGAGRCLDPMPPRWPVMLHCARVGLECSAWAVRRPSSDPRSRRVAPCDPPANVSTSAESGRNRLIGGRADLPKSTVLQGI